MAKTNLSYNMDELEKLIKTVRTSMHIKKKIINKVSLYSINKDFLDASYIERKNLAKSKIESKIKKLIKIQNKLNEFTQDLTTIKKLNVINKQLKNELINFQSSNVINKESSKKSREERILNSSKEKILKLSKFKGIYQNITYQIGYQVLDKKLSSQMSRELIKTSNILSNVVKNIFNKRDKSKNLMSAFHVEYIMKKKVVLDNGLEVWNYAEFHCSTKVNVLKSENSISEMIDDFMNRIKKYVEEKVQDSSFIFYTIKSLNIQYIYKEKTKAGSYLETPLFLQNRKSILNVKNNNDRCIDYALTGFLMLEKNPNIKLRDYPSFYDKSNEMNELKIPDGIQYPIDINKDIPKYEKLNNMKINVFIPFENKIIPLYNTNKYYERICNVILFEENENKHICLITNINNLLGSTKGRHEMHHCTNCLGAHFETKEKLDIHFKNCMINESSNAVYPTKGVDDKLYYDSFDKEFKHPFYCSLDFEATLEKHNDYKGKTNRYQHHRANSYGIKYNCIHEEYSKKIKIYDNKDENEVMKELMKDIEGYARKSYKLIKQNEKTYDNNNEVYKIHRMKTNCDCCRCEFNDDPEYKDNHKIFHHDHITGEYISSLCNECNLKMQYKKFLPVYVHNLKNYDSHFIVRALNKYSNDENDNISCIPNNEEKYISFSKNIVVDTYINKKGIEKNIYFEIRFLDTFSFMSTSLSELVDNLRGKNKPIDELRTIFKNTSNEFVNDEQFEMMIMKGVYPYDFIDNYDKLHYPRLPDKKEFYSKLNNFQIDDKEYKRALDVWDVFDCKSFIDYHNIYLKSDVLLLADIWDNFREVCYKNYALDCCYFYTAPGLSWCAWMKISLRGKEKIELITDPDMYLLFEKSIRGGLSQISHRYAEVKEDSNDYITYLDANALYSHAMLQYLPVGKFEWDNNEWTKEKILSIGDEDSIGYLFEVDLEYLVELHDLHNGYCLAPENIIIKNEMLNKFQQDNRNDNTKISKLTTNFYDKIKYGVSYRTLKLYLSLGLVLKKVHRVVKYNQKPIMRDYINKNTELRQQSNNDFEKDFFKLLNNAIFGKSMENVRNRINFRLINNEKSFDRITSSIKKITEFGEDEIEMLGVHLLKKETLLNKPIFLGQCILDQSKHLMFDFHYNFMLKQFKREDIDLLFTDTDSLCYNIRNNNPYEVFLQHKDKFDNSEYPKDHPMYDSTNMKVCGKFKNEAVKKGKVYDINKFIGLRSKVYAYKVFGSDKEDKRAKGTKKSVTKKDICFNDYYNTNFTKENFDIKQNGFRSYKHHIYTETVSKIALSCYDDKVYICDNMINTYSLGHYRTFNKSSQNI